MNPMDKIRFQVALAQLVGDQMGKVEPADVCHALIAFAGSVVRGSGCHWSSGDTLTAWLRGFQSVGGDDKGSAEA